MPFCFIVFFQGKFFGIFFLIARNVTRVSLSFEIPFISRVVFRTNQFSLRILHLYSVDVLQFFVNSLNSVCDCFVILIHCISSLSKNVLYFPAGYWNSFLPSHTPRSLAYSRRFMLFPSTLKIIAPL